MIAIHCFSDLNPWMDCIVLVNEYDADRAERLIKMAIDRLWDDATDECYGDLIEHNLADAEIDYAIKYGISEDDEAYEKFVVWLLKEIPQNKWRTIII